MKKLALGLLVIGVAAAACGDQSTTDTSEEHEVLYEFGETPESVAAGLKAKQQGVHTASKEDDDGSTAGPAPTATYSQLYATPDGQTHWRDVTEVLTPTLTAPPAQPVGVSPVRNATGSRWVSFQPGWGTYDHENNVFHTASSNRYMVVNNGTIHVQASDGEVRKFKKGDLFDFNDGPGCNCAGHIAWIGDDGLQGFWAIHTLTAVQ